MAVAELIAIKNASQAYSLADEWLVE